MSTARSGPTELKRIADCAALAVKNGIEPHAGHGLTFDNVVPVAAIPQLAELNIGHFLVGEAIFTGLDASVRRMRELMDEARFLRDKPSPFRHFAPPSLSRLRERNDRRHRLRPVQHRADPEVARPLRRPLPQPRLHRRSSGPRRRGGRTRWPARCAKRFAAKEAFSKAVGTGFKRGVFMKDIGVVNAPSGAPTLQLTGGARARLDALAPAGHAIDVHLTMTDDHPWAQAFVILSARKMEP